MFATTFAAALLSAGAVSAAWRGGWKYPYYEPCKDIGLALDESGSITVQDFDMMNAAAIEFVKTTSGTDQGVQFANHRNYYVTYWSSAVNDMSGFMTNKDDAVVEFMEPQTRGGGGTNIEAALDNQFTVFQDNDVKDGAIILVTDGQSNQGDPTVPADKIKAAGYWLITVGIGSEINDAELEALASEKKGKTLFFKIADMTMIDDLLEGPVLDLFKKQKCKKKKRYPYYPKKTYGYGYGRYPYKRHGGYPWKPYYGWRSRYHEE